MPAMAGAAEWNTLSRSQRPLGTSQRRFWCGRREEEIKGRESRRRGPRATPATRLEGRARREYAVRNDLFYVLTLSWVIIVSRGMIAGERNVCTSWLPSVPPSLVVFTIFSPLLDCMHLLSIHVTGRPK